MKKWKKVSAMALVVIMLMASVTGCGGNNDKKDVKTNGEATEGAKATEEAGATKAPEVKVTDVQLKVWAPEEEQEITTKMCDLFATNHPEYNITFEYAVMGTDASIDELKKDADLAADVFLYPSGGVPELVEAGLIYPITLNADVIKSIDSETAIKSCSSGDLLYGVPQSPNAWFMYYNSSMYTEEEVKSLETMMAKDLGKGISNFSCSISNSWYMEAFFYATGGTLYGANGDDPTECSWNDASGFKVGQYLINLSKNAKYVEDIDGIAASLFKEGKLGAMCSGTWSAEELKTALGENYAACKLPTVNIDGTDTQLKNFADFRAYGVKSATKFPEAAQLLATWLGGEECQLMAFEALGTAPTVTSLLAKDIVKADQAVSALSEQAQHAVSQPTTSQLSEYWMPAEAFGTGIINGDITESNLQKSLDTMVTNFSAKLVGK